jgi:K+ transporter
VLADMLLTTHFMALVMMTVWKIPIILPLIFYVVFAAIEATYWSATLVKVPEGVLHWTRSVNLDKSMCAVAGPAKNERGRFETLYLWL